MSSIECKTTVAVVDTNQMRRAAIAGLFACWAEQQDIGLAECTPDDLLDPAQRPSCWRLILLSIGGGTLTAPKLQTHLRVLQALAPHMPIVVISDREEPEEIVTAYHLGCQGYVLTSMDRRLALHAISFILAGGSYFPPVALRLSNLSPSSPPSPPQPRLDPGGGEYGGGRPGNCDSGGGSPSRRGAAVPTVAHTTDTRTGRAPPVSTPAAGPATDGLLPSDPAAAGEVLETAPADGGRRASAHISIVSTGSMRIRPACASGAPAADLDLTPNLPANAVAIAEPGPTEAPRAPAVEAVVAPERLDGLTHRQAEVLVHLSRGQPNKIIARELGLTEGTVKVHVRQIMRKLGAVNRTQAAILCQQVVGGDTPAPGWTPRPRPVLVKDYVC